MSAIVTTVLLLAMLQAQTPEADSLNKKALDARRRITRGEWRVVTRGEEQKEPYFFQATIYMDGKKIRWDYLYPYEESHAERGKQWRRTSCFADTLLLSYLDRKEPNGATFVATVEDLNRVSNPLAHQHPDPRMIGMTPNAFETSHHFQLESYVGGPSEGTPKVSRDQIDDQLAWRVEYMHVNDCKVRYWIVPDKGYNVVKMEAEFEGDGIRFCDRSQSDFALDAKSGLWFPQRYRFRRTENGTPTSFEDVEITTVSLNKPIAPRLFTLATMNVPPGTVVQRIPADPRGSVFWDGKDIVPMKETRPVGSGRSIASRWVLAGVSLVFAAVGCFAAWRYLRAR